MNTIFWKETLPIKLDDILSRLINIVLLILVLIGAYFVYDAWYVFYYDKAALASYKPSEGNVEKLRELSKDIVAWIYMHDTDLDFPIVQGKDNVEYLNKAPDGSYSLAGSIFLDERNNKDFSDPYNLTYGHHMTDYEMFGVLDRWRDEEFFNNNREGTLWLVDGRELKVEAFAFIYTDSSINEIFDADGNYDRMGFIKENAEFYFEPKTEHILSLSTCKQPNTTSRMALLLSIIGE